MTSPPDGSKFTGKIEYYDTSGTAESATLADWAITIGYLTNACARKGEWLHRATIAMCVSVGLLVIPMIVACILKI